MGKEFLCSLVYVVPQGARGVHSICLNLQLLAAVFCSFFVSSVLRGSANLNWSKKSVCEGRGLKKRKTRMILATAPAVSSKTES